MLQPSEPTRPQPLIGRWSTDAGSAAGDCCFVPDSETLQGDLAGVTVVAPAADEAHLRALLLAGAGCVLIGDAALRDSSIIGRLAAEFGAWRVGAYVPAARKSVSWTLDTVSNADFRCLTPSIGAPGWEVLTSDGQRTGAEVGWWIEQMAKIGASFVLLAKDVEQDDDLNIGADLAERFGPLVGVTPLHDLDADLLPWLQFGHLGKIVIPATARWNDEAVALLEQQIRSFSEALA